MGAGELIVEVIAVGTELLLGQIVNTNAAIIGGRLADEGHDIHYSIAVGDNLRRLVSALNVAVDRADAVVITGGIGPTQDDLTREALCELAGVAMTRDLDHARWIDARLRAQGRDPAPNVMRMADLPEGAAPMRNQKGVALGIAMEHHGKHLFAMPGVPAEMIPMLDDEVVPRLRETAGEPEVLHSRVLHCWGMGESSIADRLDDLFATSNPSVAFLIRDMEVRVRITAKAGDETAALELIAPVEREVRERLGAVVFGVDDQTVEELIFAGLAVEGWTVATVETATLGQVGSRLAAAGAASGRFAGSVITGVGPGAPPAADVVLEVGPIGSDPTRGPRTTRPVEMVATTPSATLARTFDLGGDDERLRSFATIAGLHLIRLALEEST